MGLALTRRSSVVKWTLLGMIWFILVQHLIREIYELKRKASLEQGQEKEHEEQEEDPTIIRKRYSTKVQ